MKKHLIYWLKLLLIYGALCSIYSIACVATGREFSVPTVVIGAIVPFCLAICNIAKHGPVISWRRGRPRSGEA